MSAVSSVLPEPSSNRNRFNASTLQRFNGDAALAHDLPINSSAISLMAEPIYDQAPRTLEQEPHPHLHAAPGEHPEAMLDFYAVLQFLRDKGILEMIKNGLGSMEKVMEVVSSALEREEVVRSVRNVTILVKMLGSIEPDALENIMKSLSNATEGVKEKKPPGLLHLFSQLSSEDTRRALGPLAAALQAFGRCIPGAAKEEGAR